MRSQVRSTVDIVMLGSFGVWSRGTLQSRALPLAQVLSASTNLRVALVTTPWDDSDQAGVNEVVDGVAIYNTQAIKQIDTFSVVREQLHLLSHLKPALVHVMKPKAAAGLTADILLRARHRPRLLVDYDDWEGDGGWNDHAPYHLLARRLFSYQERRLLLKSDAVTAASTLLESRATHARRSLTPRDVTFLPNGLNDAWKTTLQRASMQRDYRNNRTLVLYSRFAEFSPFWMDQVLVHIDRAITSPLSMHIIGEPQSDAWVLGGLRNIDIIHHGYVKREAIPGILSDSSIALFPYEDNLINRSKQSVKLLELMAAGCAIVASDVGDIRRIGRASLALASHGDAKSFACEVLRLVDDPQRRELLGRTAQERSEMFRIDRIAGELGNLYAYHGIG